VSLAGVLHVATAAQKPPSDAERIAQAQHDAPFRTFVPSKLPLGTRLMAVVIAPRPASARKPAGFADFGLVLTGNPYAVHSVMRNSLADRAGIKPGDAILQVNGRKTESLSPETLLEQLDLGPANKLELTVQRGQKILNLTLAPQKNVSPVKQFVLTYTRKSRLLELIQYPNSSPIPATLPPAAKAVDISGHRGALIHIESDARLIWRQSGLAFAIVASEDAFTDAEILAAARSMR